MDEIKILLTSDLHLGKKADFPFENSSSRYDTFKKISDLASEYDLFLIAGDFIEAEGIDQDLLQEIDEKFFNLNKNNTEIYYTPGSCETDENGAIHSNIESLKDHFRLFSYNGDETCFKSASGEIYIHGPSTSGSDCPEFQKNQEKQVHLGLFYGNFDTKGRGPQDSPYISGSDIKKLGLDFYAMGMNHSFRLFKSHNKIIGAYPGSPEPCNLNETGDRFVISITVKENSIKKIKRIPVNTERILTHELTCEDFSNAHDLVSQIDTLSSENIISIIILQGKRSYPLISELDDFISKTCKRIKITDKTIPELEVQSIECKNTSHMSLYNVFLKNLIAKLPDDSDQLSSLSESVYKGFSNEFQEGRVYCSSNS